MSFRYNPSDIEMHIDAINFINQMCNTSYSINDLKGKDDIFTNIDLIQIGKNPAGIKLSQIRGNFFGKYGHDKMSGMYEYAYIIAFVLGCKDFIGKHKCLYSSNSGFDSYTWYGLLQHIVEFSGFKVLSDPYPDFMTYPDDKVLDMRLCPDKKKNLASSNLDESNINAVDVHKSNPLLYAGIIALLFMILSNQYVYKLTNKLGGFTMGENGPTEIGVALHGLVFFVILFLMLKYM
jgi:hypothetical protein